MMSRAVERTTMVAGPREEVMDEVHNPAKNAPAAARHPVLALASREKLAAMHYDLERGRRLMMAAGSSPSAS